MHASSGVKSQERVTILQCSQSTNHFNLLNARWNSERAETNLKHTFAYLNEEGKHPAAVW